MLVHADTSDSWLNVELCLVVVIPEGGVDMATHPSKDSMNKELPHVSSSAMAGVLPTPPHEQRFSGCT